MSTWGNLTVRDVRHNYVLAMSHKHTHVEVPLIDAEFMAAFMSYETVERAARAQWDRDDHDNTWEDKAHDAQCPGLREDYRADALAVLEAALGIEGDET